VLPLWTKGSYRKKLPEQPKEPQVLFYYINFTTLHSNLYDIIADFPPFVSELLFPWNGFILMPLIFFCSGVKGVIPVPCHHAVGGGVVGATAEAVAIGTLNKPCRWLLFLLVCFLLYFVLYIISLVCPVCCFNNPSLVISRSRSRSLSGSPRGGRRDQRRSRSLSYSRSPRRSVSPPAKERSPTPDGSRSPRSPSPRDRVSPPPKDNDDQLSLPPKDNDERNGSDNGESPRGRDSRSRSLSDGGQSPAAKGRSPSPRDNRSLSPRDNRSPSPMDNGNGDVDRPSPRGSRSP
jgi:hypothetical protein